MHASENDEDSKGRPSRFMDMPSSKPLKRQRPSSPYHSASRGQSPGPADASSAKANDTELFVWKKKVEQERRAGHEPTAESEATRVRRLKEDLEEEQRQRAQRDAERAKWEAEAAQTARQEEQDRNVDARREEASFAGKQHFQRQAIRLNERRPVLTDQFARIIRLDLQRLPDGGKASSDIVALADSIPSADLSDLLDAVEDELDYIPDFPTDADDETFNRMTRWEFWQCVRTVLTDRLDMGGSKRLMDGIHSAVQPDVENLLQGKPVQKLRQLEREIVTHMEPGGEADGDGIMARDTAFAEVDFWISVLKLIRVSLARQRLNDIARRLRLERLKRTARLNRKGNEGSASNHRQTENARTSLDEKMVQEEAAKGMGEDEETFADEVAVSTEAGPDDTGKKQYLPNDKYRPRKPRYYNRVYTRYNWSKYNRTHYDHDNPPPKMVQGYKFNIFYPDLIDTATPTYHVKKTDSPDVSIITFKAGPPYEDVAFKIVNHPWERSHKRGYRCSFDRGVLQLWFYFQRYRYRR